MPKIAEVVLDGSPIWSCKVALDESPHILRNSLLSLAHRFADGNGFAPEFVPPDRVVFRKDREQVAEMILRFIDLPDGKWN